MTPEELKKAIRAYRQITRLTYTEMGRVFEVHRTTVHKIVNGERIPSREIIARIEKVVRRPQKK